VDKCVKDAEADTRPWIGLWNDYLTNPLQEEGVGSLGTYGSKFPVIISMKNATAHIPCTDEGVDSCINGRRLYINEQHGLEFSIKGNTLTLNLSTRTAEVMQLPQYLSFNNYALTGSREDISGRQTTVIGHIFDESPNIILRVVTKRDGGGSNYVAYATIGFSGYNLDAGGNAKPCGVFPTCLHFSGGKTPDYNTFCSSSQGDSRPAEEILQECEVLTGESIPDNGWVRPTPRASYTPHPTQSPIPTRSPAPSPTQTFKATASMAPTQGFQPTSVFLRSAEFEPSGTFEASDTFEATLTFSPSDSLRRAATASSSDTTGLVSIQRTQTGDNTEDDLPVSSHLSLVSDATASGIPSVTTPEVSDTSNWISIQYTETGSSAEDSLIISSHPSLVRDATVSGIPSVTTPEISDTPSWLSIPVDNPVRTEVNGISYYTDGRRGTDLATSKLEPWAIAAITGGSVFVTAAGAIVGYLVFKRCQEYDGSSGGVNLVFIPNG
jgi:hypothetical protein